MRRRAYLPLAGCFHRSTVCSFCRKKAGQTSLDSTNWYIGFSGIAFSHDQTPGNANLTAK